MEEKMLIKSEKFDLKKLIVVLVGIGLAISFIWLCSSVIEFSGVYNEHEHSWRCLKSEYQGFSWDVPVVVDGEAYCFDGTGYEEYTGYYYPGSTESLPEADEFNDLFDCYYAEYGNAFSYGLAGAFGEIGLWIIPLAISVAISVLLYLWLNSSELTVTDKRVYGQVAISGRVDLPMDSVSATATVRPLKGVSVSTASGKISFLAVKNADEIYKVISELLVNRQQEKKAEPVFVAPVDEVDQLRRYKELLDSGVITQEDYDAKKKQLLGL